MFGHAKRVCVHGTIAFALAIIGAGTAFAATDTQLCAAYCLGVYNVLLAKPLPQASNPALLGLTQEMTRLLQARAAQMRALIMPTIFEFDPMEMAQIRAAVNQGEQYMDFCLRHYFDAGKCNLSASPWALNRTPY